MEEKYINRLLFIHSHLKHFLELVDLVSHFSPQTLQVVKTLR